MTVVALKDQQGLSSCGYFSFQGFGKLHDDTDSTMGIYDGKEFLFKSTGYSILDKIKLFFRYGFGLLKMDSLTSETVKRFEKIYNLQDKEQSFETAFEFMNTLGGDAFLNLTKNSAKKILLERGISEKIIDELATAVTRCNYGQDMHVNAFTGMFSLRFILLPESFCVLPCKKNEL